MGYANENVVRFGALVSTVSSELIQDGQARDILNLRQEKIGKLVSRDGYIIGAFTQLADLGEGWTGLETNYPNDYPIAFEHYTEPAEVYRLNHGFYGIKEFILSSKSTTFDTDRLMVYAVRKPDGGGYMLFSPLTGQFKNQLFLSGGLVEGTESNVDLGFEGNATWGYSIKQNPGDRIDTDAQGFGQNEKILVAPKRFIPSIDDPNTYDDSNDVNELHRYVTMNQYRNKLVVSDINNGDFVIEDEADRTTENQGESLPHKLRMRENKLDRFNVDIVEVFGATGTGEENDPSEGIETGMALYNYVLPKATTITTTDNYQGKFSDEEKGINAANPGSILEEVKKNINARDFDTLISVFQFNPELRYENWYDGVSASSSGGMIADIFINSKSKYTFTNSNTPTEYDDLLGKVELDKVTSYERGEVVEDVSADTYVWDEVKLKYYPSSGAKQRPDSDKFRYFMRGVDRFFNKIEPETVKVTKLTVETDSIAGEAPVGAWKYRFVWDFGDEQYSAPSAELVVPDMLWSAIPDNTLLDGNPSNDYNRPRYLDNDDFDKEVLEPNQFFPYGNQFSLPKMFDASGTVTEFGLLIAKLKKKLLPTTHKYGISDDSFTYISGLDDNKKGDLGVLATAFFSKSNLTLHGTVWEGMAVSNGQSDRGFDKDYIGYYKNLGAKNVYRNSGQLIVPIFQGTNPYEWNSLFDDNGKLRTVYLNKGFAFVRNTVKEGALNEYEAPIQIVLPGHNVGIGTHRYVLRGTQIPDPAVVAYAAYTDIWADRYESFDEDSSSIFSQNGTRTFASFGILWSDYVAGDNNLYLNFNSTFIDKNNAKVQDEPLVSLLRPHTVFRGVKDDIDKLLNINSDLPIEVRERLLKTGTARLDIVDETDDVSITSSEASLSYGTNDYTYMQSVPSKLKTLSPKPPSTYRNFLERTERGTPYPADPIPDSDLVINPRFRETIKKYRCFGTGSTFVMEALTDSVEVNSMNHITNLNITIYGNGERLLIPEQLTSYFPSSLLFGSPRLRLRIQGDANDDGQTVAGTIPEFGSNIPPRAKRLLVFRTKNSLANDYVPDNYGLVQTIDIDKDTNGALKDIWFFDDVLDTDLDFEQDIEVYEGRDTLLRSRFNIPIAERVFYGNYYETYQPIKPRTFNYWDKEELTYDEEGELIHTGVFVSKNTGTGNSYLPDTYYQIVDDDTSKFDQSISVRYKYLYVGVGGIVSKEVTSDIIQKTGTTKQSIVLHLLPGGVSGVEKVKIYRRYELGNFDVTTSNLSDIAEYYYVGEVDRLSEGIFVDNGSVNYSGIPGADRAKPLGSTQSPEEYYPDAIKWSEPYDPSFIKDDSWIQFGAGDGQQITGLANQYGNLVIFKENSIYRSAVQGDDVPISRTDIVSSDVGCIAPNTIISVNDVLYFLSWKGWMRYNHNQFDKIDGAFDEELQLILEKSNLSDIRDASAGYNQSTNEIYLNIPMLPTNTIEETGQTEEGNSIEFGYERKVLGHIYVLNLDKEYATKFSYTTSIENFDTIGEFHKFVESQTSLIRLYYNNSLGELRSADILPSSYNKTATEPGLVTGGLYIETPYSHRQNEPTEKDYDELIDGQTEAPLGVVRDINYTTEVYPSIVALPVKSKYRSKSFTGDDETLLKRVRKVLLNLFSKGRFDVRGNTIWKDEFGDNRIDDDQFEKDTDTFTYKPTDTADLTNYTPHLGLDKLIVDTTQDYTGTGSNKISFVPNTPYDETNDEWDDRRGKPIRFNVDIDSELRTQINAMKIYWRPIRSYLS